MKTIQQLAQEALDIQDACNLSGLIHGWSRSISDLRACKEWTGTEEINTHPINKLWASKVHDLTRMGFSDTEAYVQALIACQKLATGEGSS